MLCTYVVSYIMIAHGRATTLTRYHSELSFRTFRAQYSQGLNCPGKECAQFTDLRVEEFPNGFDCYRGPSSESAVDNP